MAVPAK